jgi:hypothetical protein
LGGSGTISNGTTAITINSGGTITAGADALHVGTLTTGNETWSKNGGYAWQIASTAGPAGTGWDEVAMQALSVSATSGTGNSFTVHLSSLGVNGVSGGSGGTGGAATSGFSAGSNYTWVIGTVSSFTGPSGFAFAGGGTTILASGGGPNVPAVTTGDSGIFALDTSAFLTANSLSSGQNFALELVGGNATTGMLEVVYNGAPEPAAAMLFLTASAPMLTRRRRRQ